MKPYTSPAWSQQIADDERRRAANLKKAQAGLAAAAQEQALDAELVLQSAAFAGDPDMAAAVRKSSLAERRRMRRQQLCAASFGLARVANDNGSSSLAMLGRRCRRPGCPVCMPLKGLKMHQQIVAAYDRALTRIPGLRPIEITVTQPATPFLDLAKGIDRLHRALRIFFKTKPMLSAFPGAFRRTEVVWNEDSQHWHVHAHLCVLAREGYFDAGSPIYLNHERLTELWCRAMRHDGFLSVNVRAIRDPDTGAIDADGVRRGFWHLSKYLVKPGSLFQRAEDGSAAIDPALALEFARAIHGKRFHAYSGVMSSRWKPR